METKLPLALQRPYLKAYPEQYLLMQGKYKDEAFVHVLQKGQIPHTRYVRGSNYNHISVFEDRLSGRAIIISGMPASHIAIPVCLSVSIAFKITK